MATRKAPTIRATIGKANPRAEAQQPTTPMVGAGSLVAMRDGQMVEVITVRTYFSAKGTGMQPVRACVWVKPATPGGEWFTGRGSAGGCGYHKESAAIADAVSAAGFELWGNPYSSGRDENPDMKKRFHFGGTGSSAYEEIFKAIGRAVGYKGRMVWVSHGL
jgi:hypothetical protein